MNNTRKRTIMSYVGLLSAILAIVAAIVLRIYGNSVGDFLPECFYLLMAGGEIGRAHV